MYSPPKLPNLQCVCFSEDALRNASMFFRSEPTWSVVEPLKDIGELVLYLCVCVFTSLCHRVENTEAVLCHCQ